MSLSSNQNHQSVFTVGHSNLPWQAFSQLLRTHNIDVLIDVRSVPFSKFCPQYNYKELKRSCNRVGVQYCYLGKELGEYIHDPRCTENGRLDIENLVHTENFRTGFEKLLKGIGYFHVCLMCTEKDPISCHRFYVLGRVLSANGVRVEHIHSDSSIESQEVAFLRYREARLTENLADLLADVPANSDALSNDWSTSVLRVA